MTPPALFMIELRVADWPRAVAWYRDVLGLPLTQEDDAGRFALFEAGAGRIALKGDGVSGRRESARLVFQVADLDAERARLIGLGAAVDEVIENRREGYREARLSDPDGTSISLFAWSP